MAIQARLKKWGNSMAIIVPNRIIEERKLKENYEITIEVGRNAIISNMFGRT